MAAIVKGAYGWRGHPDMAKLKLAKTATALMRRLNDGDILLHYNTLERSYGIGPEKGIQFAHARYDAAEKIVASGLAEYVGKRNPGPSAASVYKISDAGRAWCAANLEQKEEAP